MKPNELELLKELDLDDEEIKVYEYVIKIKNAATVSKIAENMNFDRTKAYRIMARLINLGLIETTFSKPKKVLVVNPQQAIGNLISTKEEQLNKINRNYEQLIHSIESMRNSNIELEASRLTVISNLASANSYIKQIFEESQSEIFMMTTQSDLARLNYANFPDYIKRFKEKNQIHFITEEQNHQLMEDLKFAHIDDVRLTRLPSNSRIISSDSRLIMSNEIQNKFSLNDEEFTILYTTDKTLVKTLFNLIRLLWNKAKPLQKVTLKR